MTSCEVEVVASVQWSSGSIWGCPAVVEGDVSRKVDSRLGNYCKAFLIGGRNFDYQFSCRGQLKKHVYVVSPRTIEDLMAKTQAAVSTVVDMLSCVRGLCVLHIAACLELNGSSIQHFMQTTKRP
jgi:hypothetical protein